MGALVLEHVSHSYGDREVVHDLRIDVPEGQIACLLGPSGCGKTTTLRLIAGLEKLQAGTIRFRGQSFADSSHQLPPEARSVGMVFQDYALFPHLTVAENVGFGLRELSREERKQRVEPLLQRLGITALARSYPHRLSGGEQQRVALARALAARPALMLMDEPFANLDIRLRDQVRDDTLSILRQEDVTCLLVTHDPEEAMLMADQITVMRNGRSQQTGTPAELYSHPVNRFIAEFFSELNVVPGSCRGDGQLDCVFGQLPCGDSAVAGGALDVLIRPEGIQRVNGNAGINAEVLAARRLGAIGLVDLKIKENALMLRAKWPPFELPEAGDEVKVDCDPLNTFVFPVEKP